jgi:hypothetical protein
MAIEIATGRTTLMPPPNCRAPDGPSERLKPMDPRKASRDQQCRANEVDPIGWTGIGLS